jgi:hypothetical protein
LAELRDIPPVPGKLRTFEPPDRVLVIPWIRAFDAEVREPETEPDRKLDDFLASGQIWLWENNGISSMAVSRNPIARVVRFLEVYTPPEKRKCGYAAACVYEMSKYFTSAGHRCILYTDLGNPYQTRFIAGLDTALLPRQYITVSINSKDRLGGRGNRNEPNRYKASGLGVVSLLRSVW